MVIFEPSLSFVEGKLIVASRIQGKVDAPQKHGEGNLPLLEFMCTSQIKRNSVKVEFLTLPLGRMTGL